MKIIFFGDIVGKSGRNLLIDNLSTIIKDNDIDFVCVNGENAAHGFGITKKMADELFDAGVDVITLGNHTWDKQEIFSWIDSVKNIIRPANYPGEYPGKGSTVVSSKKGHLVLVSNVLGRVFMDPMYENPFAEIDLAIPFDNPVKSGFDACLLDVHCEATSEKQIIGHYLDGRATLVVGTHTHVPTSDTRILNGGTGYQTDLGMCGCYDSVIGMNKEIAVNRMLGKLPRLRNEPAEGNATLSGVIVETDESTGLAKDIKPFIKYGVLSSFN